VIHPGPENIDLEPSGDRFECLRFAAEVLGQVAEHCRQVGIGRAIENKLPHLLFASIRDLLWILASMGQVPIGVCLDTGHGQLTGDLRSIIQKLTGYLLMVHAHDNHGRGDDQSRKSIAKITIKSMKRVQRKRLRQSSGLQPQRVLPTRLSINVRLGATPRAINISI
jgi:sugar phosphate isomerase/epimerase